MTRAEAKLVGLVKFNSGDPCIHGHTADRYVSSGNCIECLVARSKATKRRYIPEASKRRSRRYYAKPEKMAAQVERTRKWRAANPEKHLAIQNAYIEKTRKYRNALTREWGRQNREMTRCQWRKRHARKKAVGGEHTAEEILALGVRQKWRCANPKCRAGLKPGYHADHVMPLALGGSNDIRNIQLLCPPCNHRKHAKHPVKWARELGLLI